MFILAIVISMIINCVVAFQMENIAQRKGYKASKKYFWFCFLLGLPGWLIVVALPDQRIEKLIVDLGNSRTQGRINSEEYSSHIVDKRETQRRESDVPMAAPSGVQGVDKKLEKNIENVVSPIPVDVGKIKCPRCRTIQNSNRVVCWECNARFTVEE